MLEPVAVRGLHNASDCSRQHRRSKGVGGEPKTRSQEVGDNRLNLEMDASQNRLRKCWGGCSSCDPLPDKSRVFSGGGEFGRNANRCQRLLIERTIRESGL